MASSQTVVKGHFYYVFISILGRYVTKDSLKVTCAIKGIVGACNLQMQMSAIDRYKSMVATTSTPL